MYTFLLSKIEVGSHLYLNITEGLHLHLETVIVSTLVVFAVSLFLGFFITFMYVRLSCVLSAFRYPFLLFLSFFCAFALSFLLFVVMCVFRYFSYLSLFLLSFVLPLPLVSPFVPFVFLLSLFLSVFLSFFIILFL